MSNPNGHASNHSADTHDQGSAHGPVEDPAFVIKEGSAQDWLLILVAFAALLGLVFSGFNLSQMPVAAAENQAPMSNP